MPVVVAEHDPDRGAARRSPVVPAGERLLDIARAADRRRHRSRPAGRRVASVARRAARRGCPAAPATPRSSKPVSGPRGATGRARSSRTAPCGGARPAGSSSRTRSRSSIAREAHDLVPALEGRTATGAPDRSPRRAHRRLSPIRPTRTLRSSAPSLSAPHAQPDERKRNRGERDPPQVTLDERSTPRDGGCRAEDGLRAAGSRDRRSRDPRTRRQRGAPASCVATSRLTA